jgi:hypothetical protein
VAAWVELRAGIEKGQGLVREIALLKAEVALAPSAERAAPAKPEAQSDAKEIDRCDMSGGVPVMGETWRVVCLKPDAVQWRSLYRSAE